MWICHFYSVSLIYAKLHTRDKFLEERNTFPRKKYLSRDLIFAQSQVILISKSIDWNDFNDVKSSPEWISTKKSLICSHIQNIQRFVIRHIILHVTRILYFRIIEKITFRNGVNWTKFTSVVKSNRRRSVFISDIYCEFRVRDALGKH